MQNRNPYVIGLKAFASGCSSGFSLALGGLRLKKENFNSAFPFILHGGLNWYGWCQPILADRQNSATVKKITLTGFMIGVLMASYTANHLNNGDVTCVCECDCDSYEDGSTYSI